MYTSAISGVDPSSSAWNAIASIKSTSPFDSGSSSSDDVAGEFDSLIDTSATDALGGASATGADAGAASASAAASTGSSANLALLRQLQDAEQSTVNVYA